MFRLRIKPETTKHGVYHSTDVEAKLSLHTAALLPGSRNEFESRTRLPQNGTMDRRKMTEARIQLRLSANARRDEKAKCMHEIISH